MADEQEHPPGPVANCDTMDEEGHFFDFIAFYKKVEFSDRAIRLEILEECRKDLEGGDAPSTSAIGSRPFSEAEEIPVNSIVIAAKSAVLRAMLSNGMRESDKAAPVVLKVTKKEKEAFKEMLHFLYAGALSPRLPQPSTTVRELLDCLVVGDKFEVPSFMGALVTCLSKRKRTIAESAELVGALTGHLGQPPKIKLLAEEARAHIISTFCDVSGTWGTPEFRKVGSDVVGILLESEELEADSEEDIFMRLHAWATYRFENLEERRQEMAKVLHLVRFRCMSGDYLKYLLANEEYQPKDFQDPIKQAIGFQALSDGMKSMAREGALVRMGVRDVHLEIVDHFDFSDGGVTSSRSASWFDKHWHFDAEKEGEAPDPLGIRLLLWSSPIPVDVSEGGPELTSDDVRFDFYVRTWPEGWWKKLGGGRGAFQFSSAFSSALGHGITVFSPTWEDVMESPKYQDSTNHIAVKLIARRYRTK